MPPPLSSSSPSSSSTSSSSLKRLTQELSRLSKSSSLPPSIRSLSPSSPSDLYTWHALIRGPPSTPYSSGLWRLTISIPQTYPLKPPTITFSTRILHPNIHATTGEICLDLLKDKWSPANTLVSCLEAVDWLLRYPEPESPLNVDMAVLYRGGDQIAVDSVVRWACMEWRAEEPRGDTDG